MALVRLDKALADQGMWSRKDVKALIRKGQVTVGGIPETDPGRKVDRDKDRVMVSGREIALKEHLYLMLHKPAGVVSATRDERERTVVDLVPPELKRPGLFPAGRLDKDTTGMMILTDDGDLAHRILSPRSHVPKTYIALLDRPVTEEMVRAFAAGIPLKGEGECLPAVLRSRGEREGEVTICEGMYHQIKRMFTVCGATVLALKRISMGALPLDPQLEEGACRELTGEELALLEQRMPLGLGEIAQEKESN
ncbi:pseudouridine synthase [Angelakisella massiliensis]|uniref:pseudouridine synthase n=1 Tax=Angelakisella massiliensis TaxID=1871018 RepID=UPI0008F8D088|nr:pseudouridine synthase [Angelakisella massiliensis]